MDNSSFPVMRDFFYLGAVFLGIGFGFLTAYRKRHGMAHNDQRFVTASIYMFAAFIATTAVSLINSQKLTLITPALLIISLCLMSVATIVVCYPLKIGFPVVVVVGVLLVLLAIFVTRYPAINKKEAVLAHFKINSSEEISISSPRPLGDAKIKYYYYSKNYHLKIFTAAVSVNNYIPAFGGAKHCVILNMYFVDNENRRVRIFRPSAFIDNFFGSLVYYKFYLLDARSYAADIRLENYLQNIKYTIVFNGKETLVRTLIDD